MNARERGFLLLSSHLGDPNRKSLTPAQLRTLAKAMQYEKVPAEDRDIKAEDLIQLGIGRDLARRIILLLEEEDVLDYYLQKGKNMGCVPVTRVSEDYPLILRKRLGMESPGVLWAKGDVSILREPMISLVGSRDLHDENRDFAAEVGRQAALQGYTLVSGNARGADRTAQDACLEAGGKVISVVADSLASHGAKENILYLSEDGFDEGFSAQRALSRNRVIHGLGLKTFVAQSSMKSGGTWDGTVKNLRFGWSAVFCFGDGSDAARTLIRMGANSVRREDLKSIYDLQDIYDNFFDR